MRLGAGGVGGGLLGVPCFFGGGLVVVARGGG